MSDNGYTNEPHQPSTTIKSILSDDIEVPTELLWMLLEGLINNDLSMVRYKGTMFTMSVEDNEYRFDYYGSVLRGNIYELMEDAGF